MKSVPQPTVGVMSHAIFLKLRIPCSPPKTALLQGLKPVQCGCFLLIFIDRKVGDFWVIFRILGDFWVKKQAPKSACLVVKQHYLVYR